MDVHGADSLHRHVASFEPRSPAVVSGTTVVLPLSLFVGVMIGDNSSRAAFFVDLGARSARLLIGDLFFNYTRL